MSSSFSFTSGPIRQNSVWQAIAFLLLQPPELHAVSPFFFDTF